VERVLIYRLGSLGDTVAALPCFHLIERAFPDAERLVLTNVPVSTKAAPLCEMAVKPRQEPGADCPPVGIIRSVRCNTEGVYGCSLVA